MNDVEILVRNPSDWPRAGVVVMQWQPVAKRVEEAGLDAAGIALEMKVGEQAFAVQFQVDTVEPTDPSRAALVFRLDREVPAGREDYSAVSAVVRIRSATKAELSERRQVAERLRAAEAIGHAEGLAHSEASQRAARQESARSGGAFLLDLKDGFHLIDDRLDIWLHTSPIKDGGQWYSGSASSVLLRDDLLGRSTEFLDNFLAEFPMGHDEEKRCLQVDRIRLADSAEGSFHEQRLFDRPHSLITASSGPIRASATIASAPFHHEYLDPSTNRAAELTCRLWRELSLYGGMQVVTDDLSIRPEPGGAVAAHPLYLSARYYCHMDMSFQPRIFRFPEGVADWLCIGSPMSPFQGYAFATDVHVGSVSNPHPNSPDASKQHKTFSWELGFGRKVRCLHLFGRCEPSELADLAGQAWYDFIYKPLRADLPS